MTDAPFNGIALPPALLARAAAQPQPDPAEEALVLQLLAEDEEHDDA